MSTVVIAVHKVMLTLLLDLKASLEDLGQQVTTLTEAVKDLQPSSTDSSRSAISGQTRVINEE
jgi:uncharacterized protein YlxW (UPF0749 family)